MSRPLLLTYRTLGIGDLLTAVPALRALRAAFDGYRHVLATPGWLAPLVRLVEAVDEHLPVDELEPPNRSPGPVSVAVNLHGRGPESHRLLLDVEPHRLIAFRKPPVWTCRQAPDWAEGIHEVARWCLLLEAHGVPSDPSDLRLVPPDTPVPDRFRGATVIHPGAKAPARRWPPERFAAVARAEARTGRTVLITGSSSEVGLAGEVACRAGLPGASLAGRLGLDELAALVAVAGRVVSGDTGVAHLATAFATPSVVLFGPTPPAEWGPPTTRGHRHRSLWAGRRGEPLAGTTDQGLLRISVSDVCAEIRRLDEADRSGT